MASWHSDPEWIKLKEQLYALPAREDMNGEETELHFKLKSRISERIQTLTSGSRLGMSASKSIPLYRPRGIFAAIRAWSSIMYWRLMFFLGREIDP